MSSKKVFKMLMQLQKVEEIGINIWENEPCFIETRLGDIQKTMVRLQGYRIYFLKQILKELESTYKTF